MSKIQKLHKLMIAGIFFLASNLVFAADAPAKPVKPLATPVSGVSVIVKENKYLASDVPTKTITIINNTANPIFPYFKIGEHSVVDEWLQAYFGVDVNTGPKYISSQEFRVYVGVDSTDPQKLSGLPSNSMITLVVPLYTSLVDVPNPNIENQYISWWNGGRILINDSNSAINQDFKFDRENSIPADLKSPGLTCIKNPNPPDGLTAVCPALSSVYIEKGDFPAGSPEQLAEYTLGDAGLIAGENKRTFSTTNVGYNISFVDHLYLPLAMSPEPYDGKPAIGYVGSARDINAFKSKANDFQSANTWPVFFKKDYIYDGNKLPATYLIVNGYANNQKDINDPDQIAQKLVNYWTSCVAGAGGSNAARCKIVDGLFQANLKNLQDPTKLNCPTEKPSAADFAAHVYGFVPFNICHGENGEPDKVVKNELADTPGYVENKNEKFHEAQEAYIKLQYSYKDDTTKIPSGTGIFFNPFVILVHDDKYLGVKSSYAFSIDDGTGFMHEPGKGLILAVGGTNGLPDKVEYDIKKNVNVSMGGAPGLTWTSYKVCGGQEINFSKDWNLSFTFRPPEDVSAANPCRVEMTATDNPASPTVQYKYAFNLIHTVPFEANLDPEDYAKQATYIKCDDGDMWCIAQKATDKDPVHMTVQALSPIIGEVQKNNISTPGPVAVDTINFAANDNTANSIQFEQYSLCGEIPNTNFIHAIKGQKRVETLFSQTAKLTLPCKVTLKDSANTIYNFILKAAAPFKSSDKTNYIGCTVGDPSWCSRANIDANAFPSGIIGFEPVKNSIVAPIISAKDTVNKGGIITLQFTPASDAEKHAFANTYIVGDKVWGSVTEQGCSGDPIICKTLLLGIGNNTETVFVRAYQTTADGVGKDSNTVTVIPEGGVTAPDIKNAKRDLTDPTIVNVDFTQASKGADTFTYTYTIGNSNPKPLDNPQTGPLKLTGFPLEATTVFVTAKTSNGDTFDSDTLNIDKAPVNVIIPPTISNPDRKSVSTAVVDFTPAERGSDHSTHNFTYTYTIDNGPPLSPQQISDKQMAFPGFTTPAAASVVLYAKDNVSGDSVHTDPLTIPAFGGGNIIDPPKITNAVWFKNIPNTVLITYSPASGGSGKFDYTYSVNQNSWTGEKIKVKSPTEVFIMGLIPKTVGNSITITVTATDTSDKKTASGSIVVNR